MQRWFAKQISSFTLLVADPEISMVVFSGFSLLDQRGSIALFGWSRESATELCIYKKLKGNSQPVVFVNFVKFSLLRKKAKVYLKPPPQGWLGTPS